MDERRRRTRRKLRWKFSHGRTFQLGTLEFLLVDVVYVSTITFRVRSIEESSVERENRGITGYRGGTS